MKQKLKQQFGRKGIRKHPNIVAKRIKKNENTLRDLWDNINHNICIIGEPNEKRDQGIESLFEQ